MHGAAYKNLPRVVEFLAANGANIDVWNEENRYGWTPLTIAPGLPVREFQAVPGDRRRARTGHGRGGRRADGRGGGGGRRHLRGADTPGAAAASGRRAAALSNDCARRSEHSLQGRTAATTEDVPDRGRWLGGSSLPTRASRASLLFGKGFCLRSRSRNSSATARSMRTEDIEKGQIQPASLDLRLGRQAYRLQASFLPGDRSRFQSKLSDLAMARFDLSQLTVLEKGCVYLVKLMEGLRLPKDLEARANPKSTTGRLDVFTRLITECGAEFERVEHGYSGPLYAEIMPRTFFRHCPPGGSACRRFVSSGETRN